jgi:hypothetical protein
MKDSFILYTEQKEVVDKLTDEQAGKVFKAIYEYVETDKMPKLDSLLDIIIIPFKQSLDRSKEKWEEIKKKRSEAGKIGAEIKKQKQAKEANAKFAKNKIANQAVNVSVPVPVNVSVNDNKKEKTKKKTFDDVFAENAFSEDLKNVIKDFIDMRKAIKKPMTTKALELLIKNLNKLTNLEEEKIEILNQSIEHSWQTVYPLKTNKMQSKNASAEEEFLNEQE